jgi:hypothetical protein
LQINSPLKKPGTRLANEYHGTIAGKIWRHDLLKIDGRLVYLPRRCPDCLKCYTFDRREPQPYCPECGEPPEDPVNKEPTEIQKFRRLKAAKIKRIIHT